MPHVTDALRLHNVSVPFGSSPGLAQVNLQVAPGERLVLLGPSGEGKTSLLRAIAGLSPIAGGHVTIGELDATALPPEARSAVYLHQQPVLFPHLSVRENVAFPLLVRGVPMAERARVVRPLLERLGLDALADRAPHALSGGQRHRVALARALAARPRVLLLDEPLSALDPVLRADVRDAIREAHAGSDAALVLVTHDLDDAAALGDRMAVLLDRRLAQVDTPAAVFAQPASLAVLRFLDAHQELLGTIAAGATVTTPIGDLAIPAHALPVGARVHVGIRHDALRCTAVAEPGTPRGVVQSLQHRPRSSSATVAFGNVLVRARIDVARPPSIGDTVHVHVDAHTLVVFAA
jgi:putative spermidine/putrescine transport system ATP-binding protein